jgi:hypothetical protein
MRGKELNGSADLSASRAVRAGVPDRPHCRLVVTSVQEVTPKEVL